MRPLKIICLAICFGGARSAYAERLTEATVEKLATTNLVRDSVEGIAGLPEHSRSGRCDSCAWIDGWRSQSTLKILTVLTRLERASGRKPRSSTPTAGHG